MKSTSSGIDRVPDPSSSSFFTSAPTSSSLTSPGIIRKSFRIIRSSSTGSSKPSPVSSYFLCTKVGDESPYICFKVRMVAHLKSSPAERPFSASLNFFCNRVAVFLSISYLGFVETLPCRACALSGRMFAIGFVFRSRLVSEVYRTVSIPESGNPDLDSQAFGMLHPMTGSLTLEY